MNVQPYLYFGGKSEEAIEFYKGAIGAKVEMLMHFKDAPPDKSMIPPGSEDKVMHACINVGDSPIFAVRRPLRRQAPPSRASRSPSTPPAMPRPRSSSPRWARAARFTCRSRETFFATRFGMVADKFGVSWMVLHPKPMG